MNGVLCEPIDACLVAGWIDPEKRRRGMLHVFYCTVNITTKLAGARVLPSMLMARLGTGW
jgi:hypothetical protein